MNENIRRYNLKIKQKEDETDSLIGDSNDDTFGYKRQAIIKKNNKR
jgi:hypothetical protein